MNDFNAKAIGFSAIVAAKILSWVVAMPPASCFKNRDPFYDEHEQYNRVRTLSVSFHWNYDNATKAKRIEVLDSWLNGLLKTFGLAEHGWNMNTLSLEEEAGNQGSYLANVQLNFGH